MRDDRPEQPQCRLGWYRENNSQRSVGYGDGIYKSLDGGQSFQKMGLEKSEHIAKILIDPRNSDVIYVACQGPLWAPGGDRGLYKSINGGRSWEKVLSISENTGITDIVMDPRDPDTLYAPLINDGDISGYCSMVALNLAFTSRPMVARLGARSIADCQVETKEESDWPSLQCSQMFSMPLWKQPKKVVASSDPRTEERPGFDNRDT